MAHYDDLRQTVNEKVGRRCDTWRYLLDGKRATKGKL